MIISEVTQNPPTNDKSKIIYIISVSNQKRLWTIHGKKYDLTPFIKNHPGGAQILQRAQMMEDCGVMFETYHAFSNKEAIRSQLEKYRVVEKFDTSSSVPVYDFRDYIQLTNRIKLLFPDRKSIKATNTFYAKNVLFLCLYLITFCVAMLSNFNYLIRVTCGFVSGILWIILGFNVMHDGSHYAISKYPKVNEVLESIWNSFALWNSLIWGLHHVYGHHSYTGNTKYDPDLKHFRPFTRKYREDERGVNKTLRNIQDKIITFAACVLPGMYLGQSMAYLLGVIRSNLWNIKLPKNIISDTKWYEYCLMVASLYCLWKGFFLPLLAYFLACNIFYHINTTS